MISHVARAFVVLAQERPHSGWVAPTWLGLALGALVVAILVGAVVVAVRALQQPPS